MSTRKAALDLRDPALTEFWRERHLQTLTTPRPDGTPHVVPVAATLDPDEPLVRVITSRTSRKARNVVAGGDGGVPVALCQVDGRHWVTVEGVATVLDDPADVRLAEQRYAQRFRVPRENPLRVVIAVRVTRVMGHLPG
ncbi:TIGR03618 family F420-dependent PPOX class oxidoreductase [Luteipulveratus sp. YIM 133132]|uniref:pyridoxamine 5'-phosphate oxidase family protein n=1 Tax=Luteipulveratus flavus TaxID=3031728 RepID=UPI0023B00A3D|nr:TIGR03618 family F420-dependent PPOX class oxidoreductase [Luteipulveratus sp. YIM 133132]MDE9364729.1 TIGR03618 family F420-dependent PPOX class oxidoreductase [Luteipulveratus sp. YIM 133132]